MSSLAPSSSPRRQAILILGMHRSGTSALTRVLSLCGGVLPRRLVAANSANPTGFWEPQAIVDLHDAILAREGRAWDDPRPLAAGAGMAEAPALARLIASEFPQGSPILIKDPRACRLVGLWRVALGLLSIEPLVVIPVRSPLEVAASLAVRDGMDRDQAVLLWLRHVVEAERATRDLPRVFIAFDRLLTDWKAAVDGLARDLGVTLDASGAEAAVAGFLKSEARTVDSALAADDPAAAVFAWMQRACQDPALDPAPLDRLALPEGAAPPLTARRLWRAVKAQVWRLVPKT